MSRVTHLPTPTLESWQWQDKAACEDMETTTFFHPDGERGGTRRCRAAAAKTICTDCPVLGRCRGCALAARGPYGIWGGMTEEGRTVYWRSQEIKAAQKTYLSL